MGARTEKTRGVFFLANWPIRWKCHIIFFLSILPEPPATSLMVRPQSQPQGRFISPVMAKRFDPWIWIFRSYEGQKPIICPVALTNTSTFRGPTSIGNVYSVDSLEISITIKSGVGKVKVIQAGGISRPPFCVRATPFEMLRGRGQMETKNKNIR